MARPRKLATLTPFERGVVAYVLYGWMTVAEAVEALGCHRRTFERWLVALDIDAATSRARYVQRLTAKAEGTGRRPLTKAQMRARGAATMPDDPNP